MKIVEFYPDYPKIAVKKDPGQIITELIKYGHAVSVVTNVTPDNKNLEEFHGIKVIRAPGLKIFSVSMGLLFYLIRKSREIDCILFYHLTTSVAFFSLVYRLFSKKGISVVKLDNDGREWKPSIPLFFIIIRHFLRETKIVPYIISKTADIIISESPEAKGRLLGKYPFFANKIQMLPNSIEYKTILKQKELNSNVRKENKVIFIGSICYRKGIDILIKAFALIKDIYPEWIVEIVGETLEPEYKAHIEELVNYNNLGSRVILAGRFEGGQLVRKYLEAEIFCLPSRHEGSSLAILEAMCLGLPVISSNAGCSEYVLDHGSAGLLFNIDSIEELKLALIKLIENRELRKEISGKAFERFMRIFTWDVIVADLNNLIVNSKKYK